MKIYISFSFKIWTVYDRLCKSALFFRAYSSGLLFQCSHISRASLLGLTDRRDRNLIVLTLGSSFKSPDPLMTFKSNHLFSFWLWCAWGRQKKSNSRSAPMETACVNVPDSTVWLSEGCWLNPFYFGVDEDYRNSLTVGHMNIIIFPI